MSPVSQFFIVKQQSSQQQQQNKLFNSRKSFIWDILKSEKEVEIPDRSNTLIQHETENGFRYARGPVHDPFHYMYNIKNIRIRV